jgi:hypothetical protein
MASIHKVVAAHLAAQAAFHKAMIENPDHAETHHKTALSSCEKNMADCEKSLVADTLAKNKQEGDRRVAMPQGLTAIPRTGAPPAPAGPPKPNVPLEFQKICELPDDEENMQG